MAGQAYKIGGISIVAVILLVGKLDREVLNARSWTLGVVLPEARLPLREHVVGCRRGAQPVAVARSKAQRC